MKKEIKEKIIEILKTWFYPQEGNIIGVKIKPSGKESNYKDVKRIVPKIADQLLELFVQEKEKLLTLTLERIKDQIDLEIDKIEQDKGDTVFLSGKLDALYSIRNKLLEEMKSSEQI